MPLKVGLRPNSTKQTFATAGSIAINCDSIPFSLTELSIFNTAKVSTSGTAGTYNDPWDRRMASLSLVRAGVSYFSFSDLRSAHHMTRFFPPSAKRRNDPGNSFSAANVYWVNKFHFGVAPYRIHPVTRARIYDQFDLTGGIPPAGKGDLQVSGTWGVTAYGGSGWGEDTTGDITPYFIGVGKLPGEADSLSLPMAFPNWYQQVQSNQAVTTGKGTSQDIPIGDYLHSVLMLADNNASTTNSSMINPRSSSMASNIQLWDSVGSREIWTANTWQFAELETQTEYLGAPYVDDPGGTIGTVTINPTTDQGLVFWNFALLASKPHPLYGLDLRGLQKSTLQMRYDPGNSGTNRFWWTYRKYVPNPDHPANQPKPAATAPAAS